jgi:hypothetical protein
MPRLLYHSRPGNASPKRTNAPVSHLVSRPKKRRACFEQLEERRALASVTLGPAAVVQTGDRSAQAQFEAAAFPRVMQLHADVSVAPNATSGSSATLPALRLSRPQEPLLVLPGADGRPVATSIDRIQATGGIETNVKLIPEPGATSHRAAVGWSSIAGQLGPSRMSATEVKPIGPRESATRLQGGALETLQPSPANVITKQAADPDARAAVASAGDANTKNQANLAPTPRKPTASTERPSVDYSAFGNQPRSWTSDEVDATDLLLGSPRRSQASSVSASSETASPDKSQPVDGAAYLSNAQTVIFAAAAVATALVLPGIVSEIRRRRKRTLPHFAREPKPDAAIAEGLKNPASKPYRLREKAG